MGSPWLEDFPCWTRLDVAILRADQKDRGLWENETNDAAISTLWFILFKNSFNLIIIIIIIIVIIVIVVSCFYLQCLIKIVKHAYERNDSAAFWKVSDAYTSHDNFKIRLYLKMTTF